ncbi:hypothetical protein KIN20_029976 [Parelaphostrongylus tenuis]|uniref:Fungal lipase-type domain-containing protein n=1 Tax=Parelaphostrongylus tenuis TaxID=148309 RepID=A0AAD5R3I6_PARTN|nr:hypothetical protein KIN20_029976 [Parelaphostrongylus tenuis]
MLPLTSILCMISYAYATLQYSDSLARNYMFPLSAAAYSNHPEQCINHLFPNATSAWPFGGRVSKYFHDGFHKLWGAGMEEDYFFLKKAYPEYEIWITGHSLGGSLASLAAPFVVRSKSSSADEIKLVTFGQPRTGDLQFSNAHNSQVAKTRSAVMVCGSPPV